MKGIRILVVVAALAIAASVTLANAAPPRSRPRVEAAVVEDRSRRPP